MLTLLLLLERTCSSHAVSAAEQLGGQLGEMVGARRAWAADQVCV